MRKTYCRYLLNPKRFKTLREFERPNTIFEEEVPSVNEAYSVLARKHNLEEDQIKILQFY